MMHITNDTLEPLLNFLTESLGVKRINAAVHESKAVRGADNRITGLVENGAAMDRNERQVAAERAPCSYVIVFACRENDLHAGHAPSSGDDLARVQVVRRLEMQ